MKKSNFKDFKISSKTLKAIEEMGFEEASPIQSEAIPYLLEGKDIIAQAQTGTGKTAAFAIPAIEKIDFSKKELQVLVLCPTRELVIQVTEEFRKLLKYHTGITAAAVYGGQEIGRQLRLLKQKPQIIIGTPGRTIDHLTRSSLKLDTVKIAALDEADEMLNMGFRDDIEKILKNVPIDRQTIMLSATMPDEILKLMKRYQKNPIKIDVTNQKINSPKIDQYYYEINEKSKPEALSRLIDFQNIKLGLVFCNTKSKVDYLVDVLKTRGYFAEGLHGDMSQTQREKVMNGFRRGSVEILAATDVAGRGIDVNNVEAVFNYDLPRDDEDYIHRIGRTGRAGKSGKAFTFIVGKEIFGLKRIEKTYGLKVFRQNIPTLDELDETRLNAYSIKIKKIINENSHSKYAGLVEKLMGYDFSALDIAAALLKISMDNENTGFDNNQNFSGVSSFTEKKFVRNRSGNNRNNYRDKRNNSFKGQNMKNKNFKKK